jgi:hypothetical protein
MAIVATIAIDYFFSGFPRLPRGIEAVIFGFVPFVTATFVSISYAVMYVVESKLIDYDVASQLQMIAMIMAIVYSLVAKSVHFYNLRRDKT